MNIQDYVEACWDFLGAESIGTSAGSGTPWMIDDTSTSGTPTYAVAEPSNGGEFEIQLASTNEIENVCLHFGDNLCFDIDKIQSIAFGIKTVASLDSATTLTFGLTSDRNDDPDATSANAQFKLAGSNAVVCETDDTTNDNDDVSSGTTLVDSYKHCVIDFTGGKSDVKFYVGNTRVASSQTFDMSNYSGSLQPNIQLQKTADTNTDSVTIDYVQVCCKR